MMRDPLRILVLSPIDPVPPRSGWSVVIYNDVMQLHSLGHAVHLLAIASASRTAPSALDGACSRWQLVRVKRPRWLRIMRNIGCSLPFIVSTYRDARLSRAAEEIVRERQIDVVLAEDVAMAQYGPGLRKGLGVPFFVRGHNVDTQILERFAAKAANPIVGALARWQTRKCARYESTILQA